jgi:protein arginine N-methyltransferase 1
MLQEHQGYVADRIRIEQFKAAIRKKIDPGDRTADIGCGSGILGMLCLRAGAGFVYAIDSSAMLEIARESLVRAGLNDQTAFIHGQSQQIDLPERVDMVTCDHVGFFGFDYGIVHTLEDARKRFLKPTGVLVPARINLKLAAVESEKCHDMAEAWRMENVPAEFHWLRQYSVNAKHPITLAREEIMGTPSDLGVIDLYENNPEYFSWSADLCIERDGIMHGLAGWFECELAEGVWMTNSPMSEKAINRPQAFLPIDEAVPVKSGDYVKATVMARPSDNLIAWVVEFPAVGKRFSHSTWQGLMLAPEELIKANPGRVPHINREGKARMTVLSYCDGRRTVREIEQMILRDHPDLFPSSGEISRFVAHVLGRDTE